MVLPNMSTVPIRSRVHHTVHKVCRPRLMATNGFCTARSWSPKQLPKPKNRSASLLCCTRASTAMAEVSFRENQTCMYPRRCLAPIPLGCGSGVRCLPGTNDSSEQTAKHHRSDLHKTNRKFPFRIQIYYRGKRRVTYSSPLEFVSGFDSCSTNI